MMKIRFRLTQRLTLRRRAACCVQSVVRRVSPRLARLFSKVRPEPRQDHNLDHLWTDSLIPLIEEWNSTDSKNKRPLEFCVLSDAKSPVRFPQHAGPRQVRRSRDPLRRDARNSNPLCRQRFHQAKEDAHRPYLSPASREGTSAFHPTLPRSIRPLELCLSSSNPFLNGHSGQ